MELLAERHPGQRGNERRASASGSKQTGRAGRKDDCHGLGSSRDAGVVSVGWVVLVLFGLIVLVAATAVGTLGARSGVDPGDSSASLEPVERVDQARAPSPEPGAIVPGSSESAAERIVIHVSGAVANPGLVPVPPDARVADAVAAAGGVTPDADLAAVNLAGPLADGTQVIVPVVSASDQAGSGTVSGAGRGDETVSLNRADSMALQQIPGVGPVLAARIVAYRDQHGPFSAIEDLLDVPGIGEGRLADLRPRLHLP